MTFPPRVSARVRAAEVPTSRLPRSTCWREWLSRAANIPTKAGNGKRYLACLEDHQLILQDFTMSWQPALKEARSDTSLCLHTSKEDAPSTWVSTVLSKINYDSALEGPTVHLINRQVNVEQEVVVAEEEEESEDDDNQGNVVPLQKVEEQIDLGVHQLQIPEHLRRWERVVTIFFEDWSTFRPQSRICPTHSIKRWRSWMCSTGPYAVSRRQTVSTIAITLEQTAQENRSVKGFYVVEWIEV